MLALAHRVLLKIYRWLPRALRRWFVRLISPSFTVGAVCVIERHDGARLLVRQAYRSGWGLPGGLIKRGEDVADCARREVLEEIGIHIELLGEPAVVVDPPPQRVDVVYRAQPVPGVDPATAQPCSPEIEEIGWFLADEMPPLQHETVSALIALARVTSDRNGPAAVTPSMSPQGDAV